MKAYTYNSENMQPHVQVAWLFPLYSVWPHCKVLVTPDILRPYQPSFNDQESLDAK